MKINGWEVEQTGGGCEAFRKATPDGGEMLMVTTDGLLPESYTAEEVIVAVYRKDGSIIGQRAFASVAAAVRVMR